MAAKRKTASRKKTAVRKKPSAKSRTPKKAAPKARAASKKTAARKPARAAGKTSRPAAAPRPRGSAVAPPTESASFTPYVRGRDEEYMNPAQVAHFRNILLEWKRSLMEEVDRTVHHMQDEASNFPDPNDRATQEEEFALELRTRDRERKLIKKIDESLLDLEKGDYGYCEICGVEIGIKRLEARPTATLCIDCKTLDEIKEKQLG
jgi:DnaK suppressor protein